MKRPSSGLTKKERSAVVKKAVSGKRISAGKTRFEDVQRAAMKTYHNADKARAVAASVMWKGLAKAKRIAKAKAKK